MIIHILPWRPCLNRDRGTTTCCHVTKASYLGRVMTPEQAFKKTWEAPEKANKNGETLYLYFLFIVCQRSNNLELLC